ncbi:unnamed protein product, partial [Ectocarpus sp. 12 AP-2014]
RKREFTCSPAGLVRNQPTLRPSHTEGASWLRLDRLYGTPKGGGRRRCYTYTVDQRSPGSKERTLLRTMSNLMSNIRKASLPLQESSAQLGRLLLQLGQAADSQLDAETLAELDKQASVAACHELEKAAAAAAAAAPEGGEAEESTEEEDSTAVEEAGADERNKDVCVANEESSTATTVELSADSSHHEDAG